MGKAGKILVRITDALALVSLICLLFLQLGSTKLDEEASRERYDRKMREYVLSHDLILLREEAIDVRRELRNAELGRQRTARLSLAALGILGFCFLFRLSLQGFGTRKNRVDLQAES